MARTKGSAISREIIARLTAATASPSASSHHEADIAAAAGAIGGWLGVACGSVDVGHGSKLPDSNSVRAAHCDVRALLQLGCANP